jgi:protein-disulfide isomerase
LNPENYEKWVGELKLNLEQFKTCSNDPKMAQAVDQDLKDGMEAGVNGTPAFFVNGVMLSGAQPLEAFSKIIDQELQ